MESEGPGTDQEVTHEARRRAILDEVEPPTTLAERFQFAHNQTALVIRQYDQV
jgi:hypothetical protein